MPQKVSQITFWWKEPFFLRVKYILIIYRIFNHYKESFVVLERFYECQMFSVTIDANQELLFFVKIQTWLFSMENKSRNFENGSSEQVKKAELP